MKKIFLASILCLCISVAAYTGVFNIEPNGFGQAEIYKFFQNLVTKSNGQTLSYCDFHNHGASDPGYDVGATFSFEIDGVMYTKVASDSCLGVSATIQAASTACIYLVSVGTTGALTTTKGVACSYLLTPEIPALPASSAPVATIKAVILPTATTGFTLGTSNYDYSASCTITIVNLSSMVSGTHTSTALSLTGF